MEATTPTFQAQSGGKTPGSVSQITPKTFSQEELCGALIEKEYELECAQDLLQSLSTFEAECQRKDGVIRELRRELAAYKHNSHSKDISYVTMEEHLAACEDHLQLKTKEVETLMQEIDSLKNKASTASLEASSQSTTSSSKISALQRELSCKTSKILQQKQELLRLSSQHELDKESLTSLRHSVTELQANLSSLKTKVQQLKSENKDLKQKLQVTQSEKKRYGAAEQKHKEELEKLRNSLCSGKLAQAKQDFLETEVEKARQRENELAIQLGKMKEEFYQSSIVCQRVVSICTQVISATDSTPNSLTAVNVAEQLAQEYVNTQKELESSQAFLTEVQEENESLVVVLTSLKQLWTDFRSELRQATKHSMACEQVQSGFEVLVAALRKLLSQNKKDSCKELIDMMQESLQLVNSELVVKWRGLVGEIENHCAKLELVSEELREPTQQLLLLSETLEKQKQECTHLHVKLMEVEEDHKKILSAITKEHEEKLANAIEECLAAEKEKLSSELMALQQRLESEKQQAAAEEHTQFLLISEQLDTTKESLLSEQNRNDIFKAEIAGLETKLQSIEALMSEALTTAECQKETMRSQLIEEMTGYKEQSHQHALTIVALEEKLIQAMQCSKQLKAENEALSELVGSAEEQCHSNEDNERAKKLVKLTDTLRHQLVLASDESSKAQTRIKQLESDLRTVQSQIKDREVMITGQFQEQLNDLKLTLSKQETDIEGKKIEISHLKSLLQAKTEEIGAVETERNEAVKRISDMKNLSLQPNSTEESSELSLLGQRCSGEKHSDTITNQKRALAQLRLRISELEAAKPPVGSHQATLKELSRVRHELLRAKAQPPKPPQLDSEEEEDWKANEECEQKIKELQVTLSELQDTLQYSEKTYKNLVELIYKNVDDVEKPTAQSFVGDRDSEQRKDILKERKKFADILLRRLKALQQEASNKKRLSKGGKALSVGTLQDEDSPEAVIANLQAVLDTTAEELEQQRRLNQALIKRSVFKESQLAEIAQKPHHKCIK